MRELDCRAAAAQILAAVVAGETLDRVIARIEPAVRERDRALLRELCYGSLRWHIQLGAIIKPLLQKPLKARDSDIEQLLIVGAYQLLHTRIPAHAAINSAVEASRHLQKNWASGLINAVMRKIQRESDDRIARLTPSQRVAHPQWFWESIRKAWPQQAEQIFEANNAHPPMCLRVNALHKNRADYLQMLDEQGIAATPCEFSPSGLRLEQPCAVDALPGFKDGVVSVQDEAAQLAAFLLDAQPHERILDACCAPGGKTAHILETQPSAHMFALDVSSERLQRVTANLTRLNLQASVIAGDALTPSSWWDGIAFDRILLDAPCSGTGVIRRHPDIKLLRTPTDIEQLATLQLQLLQTLWPLLAPNGYLLYATCSVMPQENSEVVEQFCTAQCDVELIPIAAEWGMPQPAGRQLLPTVNGQDGFYYALLRKRIPTQPT
ncbi:MAG: 16S rRNA (cytosine(967)-C(5))-methyltransferase RsmB [Spongiibacteraceae bacterium]